MKVVTFLLDLLYPPRCAFCHDFLETSGDGLCAHCRTGLPFVQNGGRQRFSFVRACVSPLTYEGDVRASLLRYKFGGATGYAKVYGRLVADTVRTELAGEYDLVTWVPLSRKRLRQRGYDQALAAQRHPGDEIKCSGKLRAHRFGNEPAVNFGVPGRAAEFIAQQRFSHIALVIER